MARGLRRVAVVGGGPAGLFFARLIRMTEPATVVDVYERNLPDEAFGFGVVFSARTMSALRSSDPDTQRRISGASVTVSDMELRHPGATLRYGGFDFSSVSRRELLLILQEQATQAGAQLHFGHEAPADALERADIVVYADGANSGYREARRDRFGTTVQHGASPYMWLGTEARFDAATFAFVESPHGWFAAHAYPYAEGMTTVVVETDAAAWRAAGMDRAADLERSPGGSDDHALAFLSELFAEHLGGHKLIGNRSRWATFRTVRNERWSDGKAILLGDAAHTAHFTVGSGTKMAMEDAIALAAALGRSADPAAAFTEYERERRGAVSRTQEWAEPSMRWWESFGRRLHLPPAQFGLHFMTRTSAMTYPGLRRRFPDRVEEAEGAYRAAARPDGAHTASPGAHAVLTPLRLGALSLPSRLIEVLPDGCADPVAAVRSAADRGAGLVLARVLARAFDAGQHPAAVVGTLVGVDGGARGGGPSDGRPSDGGPSDGGPSDRGPVFGDLECPSGDEWSADGDDLVEAVRALVARGAAGVLLRANPVRPLSWAALLGHADRVRTETGTAVAVTVPDGWALQLPSTEADEPWSTRIHLALISGRVDLVVGGPLPLPPAPAPSL